MAPRKTDTPDGAPQETRNLRLCEWCTAGPDTLPRHTGFDPNAGTPTPEWIEAVTNLGAGMDGFGRALAEAMEPTTLVHHHECGAQHGCAVCVSVIEAAGGKSGMALQEAILGGDVDHLTDTLNPADADNSAPPGLAADHPDAVRLLAAQEV